MSLVVGPDIEKTLVMLGRHVAVAEQVHAQLCGDVDPSSRIGLTDSRAVGDAKAKERTERAGGDIIEKLLSSALSGAAI